MIQWASILLFRGKVKRTILLYGSGCIVIQWGLIFQSVNQTRQCDHYSPSSGMVPFDFGFCVGLGNFCESKHSAIRPFFVKL